MIKIIYPNGDLKETAIPNKFIGWREKDGCFQPVEVTVSEGAAIVDGVIETVHIKVETKILQTLNPAQITNED